MTINFLSRAWVLSLVVMLSACGNSPTNNYYLLSAHNFPAPVGDTPTIGVGPIKVPEYLNRDKLAYNQSDNALHIAGLDLWAEPLENGIQRVLVLNLAGLLNTQDVSYFPWHPKRAPAYGVKINVLQLESTEQDAMLTAEWLVYRPESSQSVVRRISRLQAPLTPGTAAPQQVAAAYSELMFQLSEIIAAAITSDAGSAKPNAEP
ncbi:MAG: PqiC family protein [Halioglobus sp.]